MSIRVAINRLEASGRLFHLPSLEFGEDAPRDVYVSEEVADLVFWTPPSGRAGRMASNARGLLDDFVEGGYITLGEDPFDKAMSCIMARVAPVEEELFDFRCLDPNPGLRILGAFSECDIFIALTWDYRENFDETTWRAQVVSAQQEWDALFGAAHPRHSGETVNEYISYNVRAV